MPPPPPPQALSINLTLARKQAATGRKIRSQTALVEIGGFIGVAVLLEEA
jgi:hypothetical protein